MGVSLPQYVVLQSKKNGKYLQFVAEGGELRGYMQFTAGEVTSPYVKIAVERSKATSKDGVMVHLRSCYNNKYLVRSSAGEKYIVAGADATNENQSDWACTLFKTDDATRFVHVQLGCYVAIYKDGSSSTYADCLFANSPHPDTQSGTDVMKVVDWESLCILPARVAFKGDNGRYLNGETIENHPYLHYSAQDIAAQTAWYAVFPNPDGTVRIKSDHFGKYWRRSPNWIWADSGDATDHNLDTVFTPVRVDDKTIALRNMGNNNFCKRLTTEGKYDCLNAAVSTITNVAKMVVQEIVVSRQVYNVVYHMDDAKIYDQQVLSMATQTAENLTAGSNSASLTMTYTNSKSSTWEDSVSLKLGVEVSFKAGIPLIAKSEIKISGEFDGTYQWGGESTSTAETSSQISVDIPSKTAVTVTLPATRGKCDIPFSYTRRDTLYDGSVTIQDLFDGVYTGVNCYNFYFETTQQPLSSTES